MLHQPPIAKGIASQIAVRRASSHWPLGTAESRRSILAASAKAPAESAATMAPQPEPCRASNQPKAASASPEAGQSKRRASIDRPNGFMRNVASRCATRSNGVDSTSKATAAREGQAHRGLRNRGILIADQRRYGCVRAAIHPSRQLLLIGAAEQ